MKIYTKTGDKGTTGLYGGSRVSKHDMRIDTYGDIDELNANIGHLRDLIDLEQETLLEIQKQLFNIGSHLATPKEALKQQGQLPQISGELTKQMEDIMDDFNQDLPIMTHFILPGGHPKVSTCHICRTICRRAERKVSFLSEKVEVNQEILMFLNRLSDYLFVLARKLTYEYRAEEIKWIP